MIKVKTTLIPPLIIGFTEKRLFHHGDTEDTEKMVAVHREIPLQTSPFSSSVHSAPPC